MTVSQNQNPNSTDKRKIRYAVVGLGWIAQASVLPAFAHAENSQLVALVSDDSTKRQELGKQYSVKRTYSYQEYEKCLKSGEIDAVYIALPNHLHCDYTVRAANAKIHVLCEKPMAVTEEECELMIHICESNAVKLMIAYRLHFEAANMQAVEIVGSGKIGDPRFFNSVFTQQVERDNIRVQQGLGGGTLDDMGIYCINAARYLFQDEPIEVFAISASNEEKRFEEVEEMASAILRFPQERLAMFAVSFGAASVSNYRVVGTKGDLRLEPAYDFQGEIKHYLTLDGKTHESTFAARDQFAAELIYFSNCILQNKYPEPSGMEGMNDVRIIRALYHSIETGKPVQIYGLKRCQRPTIAQTIQRPPILENPELIHAKYLV
jgi:glucose-fructose oxidoreductase